MSCTVYVVYKYSTVYTVKVQELGELAILKAAGFLSLSMSGLFKCAPMINILILFPSFPAFFTR